MLGLTQIRVSLFRILSFSRRVTLVFVLFKTYAFPPQAGGMRKSCMFTSAIVWTGNVVAQVSFGDPFEGSKLQNSNWWNGKTNQKLGTLEKRSQFEAGNIRSVRKIWFNEVS